MSSLLTAASDIALVLDETGVIREIALGASEHPIDESKEWVGQGWSETVTVESRPKIVEMLREAATTGVSRRRQVNHISPAGNDIPVQYTALRLGKGDDRLVAIGRDLRMVSALQQRLVEAQQSLERDYWRMRHIETRHRLLFQVSSEAVLVIDAATLRVVESNPAAAALFDTNPKKLVGRQFPFDIARGEETAIQDQFATVRSHGRADDVLVHLGPEARPARIATSLVRQDASALFLLRILLDGSTEHGPAAGDRGRVSQLLQAIPDGFVTTDADGQILSANRAFLDMVEVATEDQVRGQPVSRWIGRPGADLPLMLTTLKEHGVLRLFGTAVRGDLGTASEVEISGSVLSDGAPGTHGLLIRDIGRRLALGPRGARDLTRAVEQLTGLVGRVTLRDLVRDTTDLVERHFVEAALEMTDDNRTSAAEVLGVSRQSLYVKLRRYDLGNEEPINRPVRQAKAAKPRPKAKSKKKGR